MPSIGPLELVILLVIVLLIFGPKRLPGLGRQLGSGMREFRDSITGRDKDEPDRDAFGEPAEPTARIEAAPAAVEREVPAEERRPADA
jgi:sec-independent protein translocase protein TatA